MSIHVYYIYTSIRIYSKKKSYRKLVGKYLQHGWIKTKEGSVLEISFLVGIIQWLWEVCSGTSPYMSRWFNVTAISTNVSSFSINVSGLSLNVSGISPNMSGINPKCVGVELRCIGDTVQMCRGYSPNVSGLSPKVSGLS